MTPKPATLVASLAVAALALAAAPVSATIYHIAAPEAGTCGDEEAFERVANALEPGDELVLGGGTYCQTGQRLLEISGTPDAPIVIRAAPGERPILTRPGDPRQPQRFNGTEISGAYLVLRGLHFRGGNRGLVFHAGSHHITVEDCEVSDTANNGLTLNNGDTSHFVIRRNHIHHTGNLDPAIGRTEGEGMYVGCNRAECIASEHLIEGNYIHDLKASSWGGNDGIEVKYGSYGNVVRDNVIHGIAPGIEGTRYPCIFVYGVRDPDIDRPNIVEGNAVWDCGEAIQVVADTVVRNNLVLHSSRALATYEHEQVPAQRNLTIVNNSFVGSRLDLQFGSGKPELVADRPAPAGIVFANNAIYGSGSFPVVTVDLPRGGGITIAGNALEGLGRGAGPRVVADPAGAITGRAFFVGGSADKAFVVPGRGDYRPAAGSPLSGSAQPRYLPGVDFAGIPRHPPGDVGALSADTEGKVWLVQPGFRPASR